MKQYTNKEQTQHLIELGFPRPNSISDFEEIVDHQGTTFIHDYDYSIGELIEFLNTTKVRTDIGIGLAKPTSVNTNKGYIKWDWELIDNLYDLCVKLKTENVI